MCIRFSVTCETLPILKGLFETGVHNLKVVDSIARSLRTLKENSHKVDKKAMIRNRYNRIIHPALNTKRERDSYN